MTVRELEQLLLERYPCEDAEDFDKVGLSVGNPDANIAGISVALDATEETVELAHNAGSNVLVTHHPLTIQMPWQIGPKSANFGHPAATVWDAVSLGVSVISMHTNLDRSLHAQHVLPDYFGFTYLDFLESDKTAPGSGRLGQLAYNESESTLQEVAKKVYSITKRQPRVFGDPDKIIRRVAIASGSGSSLAHRSLETNADLFLTGECGYHTCLELKSQGLAVMLVGHDVSELCYVAFLYNELEILGVDPKFFNIINEPLQWWSI